MLLVERDYAFDELPKILFRGKTKEKREANAMMRDEAFWNQYRTVELTKSESSMDAFIHRIEQLKGFKYILFGVKALIENFVETGDVNHPSKVDFGPMNTIMTSNFIDGIRNRISAQTTANLNPHWFLSGYLARGWRSKKNYYKAELTYSFNKKDYLPREFPKRTITFTSTYDITSPSDKFVHTDKDNVFTAFKWAKVDKMMFYNRQQLSFEREEEWGFKTTASLVLLQEVVNSGTAHRLRFKYNLENELGGKTGTTNNNSDAWFMGLTPQLVTGCWVGGEDRDIHFNSTSMGQGATMALPIFAIYIKKVLADRSLGYNPNAKFDIPEEFDPCASSNDEMDEFGIDEVFE